MNNSILPPDPTKEEKLIFEHGIIYMYRKLEIEEMFITCMVYELGYKKSVVADILGLSNATISNRVKSIKSKLKTKRMKKEEAKL